MFTDRYIRNLKPEGKIKDIREKNGFGIRVKPDGTKIFFYRFNSPVSGLRRFLTIGEYPEHSLEKARIEYGEAYKIVKAGGDPLETKTSVQEEQRQAPTIKKLCDEYVEKHAKRFKKSWQEDERILVREVIPAWGNKKAAAVVKRDVLQLLEKIIERGSPGMANNSFQVIRKMFNFAVERDILSFSPCMGVKLPAPKQSRERALSEKEIRLFWLNLDNCAISRGIKFALKLILVTAQRPGEVVGIHTSEIDGNWWTIPSQRAKNGKTQRVPLSHLAVEIIEEAITAIKTDREIPMDQKYSGFIFPCPHRTKEQAISPHALAVATMRNLEWPVMDSAGKPLYSADGKPATENRFGIDQFTPHDLRRTAATRMAESGEMDEVIDAILNHVKQGIIKVYNQFKYDAQKQTALESWAIKLSSIITKTTK